MPNQKKILLISYNRIFRDPRFFLLAKSYEKIGLDVEFLNYGAEISSKDKTSVLYKTYRCFSYTPHSIKQKYSVQPNIETQTKKTGLYYNLIERLKKATLSNIVKSQIRTILYWYKCKKINTETNNTNFGAIINQYDILHGCELFWGGIITYYSAIKYKKKIILDIKEIYYCQDPNYSWHTQLFIKRYENKVFNYASVLPCVSAGIMKTYNNINKTISNKLIYLPNAQSLYKTTLQVKTTKKPNDKTKLVMLGGFLPEIRGIEHLIRIWEQIDSSNAILDLYLSDLTSINKKTLMAIAQKTSGSSLFIKPPVDEDKILETLNKYDIGIIPYTPNATLNHTYCCPNKFGQYLKCGLAILSTDTANINRFISLNKIGYTYSATNINYAINIFNKVISSKEELHIIKSNSVDFFKTNYNWENYESKFNDSVMSKMI